MQEAASVSLRGLQDLAALGDAHAAAVGHVGAPDCTLGVEADAVGHAVAEVGPHAAARQAAVGGDREARQPRP
jgi:hypothetical protein